MNKHTLLIKINCTWPRGKYIKGGLSCKRVINNMNKANFSTLTTCFTDFWMSDLNEQSKNKDQVLQENHTLQPNVYLHINPVVVEEKSNKDLDPLPSSKHDTVTNLNSTSSLPNGELPQTVSLPVKSLAKTTSNPEIKYKRPPPRPPSLGAGSGMGLLFSSPPSHQALPSATPEAEKKEEGRGGVVEREERKSVSTSPPPPSRPPVPLQSRAAPPLPPAPVRRTSSRKSTDREVGEGTEREKGQYPAKKAEREEGGEKGKEKARSKPGLLGDSPEQGSSSQQEVDDNKDRENTGKEDEKEEKEVKMEKEDKPKPSPQCPSVVKKPTRPVPPPRTKPCLQDSPLNNQSAGMRIPPPSPARRPDVSLYSPQCSAVLGTDPDSCSTSSTEEEGEQNQEQEQPKK